MTSLKRHVQHGVIKLKSLLKNKEIGSPHLKDRLKEVSLRNPEVFDCALFNFTIDFELIWGNGNVNGEEHSTEQRIENAVAQAMCFEPFMKMLEELNFPISWAVLGKLANADILPKESESFNPKWSINWYDGQYKNLENELWDGTDYLQRIKNSPVPHEFLSHGHAHIDYADECVSEEVARWDIETSIAQLELEDISVKGFVYPCNRHNYHHLLKDNKIDIIRGENNSWSVEEDLVQTPLGFWISPSFYSFEDVKKIIDKAVENKSFVHPWIHLIECDMDENDIENFYKPIFSYIKELEAKGLIKNITFDDIKNRVRKKEQL
jgi:peptidoglycan/xylan/chitin deacetylase (PgdA/CDA1 family)